MRISTEQKPHTSQSDYFLVTAASNLQSTSTDSNLFMENVFLKRKHIFDESIASLKIFPSVLSSYIKIFIILEYTAIDNKINGQPLNSQLLNLILSFPLKNQTATDLL